MEILERYTRKILGALQNYDPKVVASLPNQTFAAPNLYLFHTASWEMKHLGCRQRILAFVSFPPYHYSDEAVYSFCDKYPEEVIFILVFCAGTPPSLYKDIYIKFIPEEIVKGRLTSAKVYDEYFLASIVQSANFPLLKELREIAKMVVRTW